MSTLDTIEAVALAATENVRDNGYRITAPDGEVIVEYKHSPHPNAEADGALFGRAREYVLTLVAAVRYRDERNASLRAAVREFLEADDAAPRLDCEPSKTLEEAIKRNAARRRRAEAIVALAALVP